MLRVLHLCAEWTPIDVLTRDLHIDGTKVMSILVELNREQLLESKWLDPPDAFIRRPGYKTTPRGARVLEKFERAAVIAASRK